MTDERIAAQQELNRETLAALEAEGWDPGAQLQIDLFWLADDRASVDSLAAELAGRGITADVSAHTHGVFRKRTSYAARASLDLPGADVRQLDELVDEMTRLGDRHGAEFDGWGAEVPPA